LGAVGAAGLLAGGCAYAALWPGSRIFGEGLIAPKRPGELALTFDDGPNSKWTPRLLEILARHDVKATFFLIGKYAAEETVLTRFIANGGHAIGNHTWSHPNLALCGTSRVREELKRTSDTLEGITGKPVRFFRPPFGARRPAVMRIARELGLRPVLWNAMTSDWKEPSAEAIARRLSAQIGRLGRRGWAANIVLHDGGHLRQGMERGASVEAAGRLIAQYKPTRRFVTVEAWS
jgi:peptidoglycan/xylan/chitin deacetylase (PgdA/CDA1 family)